MHIYPLTQIKIFEHDDPEEVNREVNQWLENNRERLGKNQAKIQCHYQGQGTVTTGDTCSVMLVITHIDPNDSNWNFDHTYPASGTPGSFIYENCT